VTAAFTRFEKMVGKPPVQLYVPIQWVSTLVSPIRHVTDGRTSASPRPFCIFESIDFGGGRYNDPLRFVNRLSVTECDAVNGIEVICRLTGLHGRWL